MKKRWNEKIAVTDYRDTNSNPSSHTIICYEYPSMCYVVSPDGFIYLDRQGKWNLRKNET